MSRHMRVLLAALALGALFAASAEGQTSRRSCAQLPQAQDLTTVFNFDPLTARIPEGIAISRRGDIYLGVQPTGEIVRLDRQGGFSTVADLDQGGGFMLGLAVDSEGNVYAALDSFDPATHGVWQIDRYGTTRLIAAMPTSTLPNGLTFDLGGNLYVSDTFLGAVWKISRSGELSMWVASPLLEGSGALFGFPAGANGVAFFMDREEGEGADREHSGSIYVANLDRGTIVRIPILADGSAGDPTVFAEDDALISADGIQFDIRGNIYVAVNFQNTIARVDRCGRVDIAVEGLDRPASVAFGTSHGKKELLYITNFGSGQHLMSVDVGIRGLPLP